MPDEPMTSVWIGDKANGIELRPEGKTKEGMLILDELLIYRDGKCLFHLERMDDTSYWFGIYPGGLDVHPFHVRAVNGRSHVNLTTEAPRD